MHARWITQYELGDTKLAAYCSSVPLWPKGKGQITLTWTRPTYRRKIIENDANISSRSHFRPVIMHRVLLTQGQSLYWFRNVPTSSFRQDCKRRVPWIEWWWLTKLQWGACRMRMIVRTREKAPFPFIGQKPGNNNALRKWRGARPRRSRAVPWSGSSFPVFLA
jgi:hypothetical protein